MPDWPPSTLSNFGYPELPVRVERMGPNTLVTVFSDGSENIRVKSNAIYNRYTERWQVDRDDMKIIMDFYEAYGMSQSFTRRGLDPQSGDNFTTDTVLCRFEREPVPEQVGPQWYVIELVFRQTEL